MTKIHSQFDLKPYNTFQLPALAEYFVQVSSTDELQTLLTEPKWQAQSKFVLGGGSNLLFTQNLSGLVIGMQILGKTLVAEDDTSVTLKVGAGENWHQLVLYCVEHGYAGVENLALIPGTVGAAPIQNIGAYGVELKDSFVSLDAIDLQAGHTAQFSYSDCLFGYRDSIFKSTQRGQYAITSVTLKLHKQPIYHTDYGIIQKTLEEMGIDSLSIDAICQAVIKIRQEKLPDPKVIGNAGSFFKNPVVDQSTFKQLLREHPELPHYAVSETQVKLPAAWLIEQCGFKGKRVGNVGIHEHQALVLVNHGGGTGQEIKDLSLQIQTSVQQQFDITLVPEVTIL